MNSKKGCSSPGNSSITSMSRSATEGTLASEPEVLLRTLGLFCFVIVLLITGLIFVGGMRFHQKIPQLWSKGQG